MQAALTRFVRALRMADVRVSTSETLDAFEAVRLVGPRTPATKRGRSGVRAVAAHVLSKLVCARSQLLPDCGSRARHLDQRTKRPQLLRMLGNPRVVLKVNLDRVAAASHRSSSCGGGGGGGSSSTRTTPTHPLRAGYER